MAYSYIIPSWFFGLGVGLEILFGVVSLAVAITAYSCYKISEQKSLRRFSLGFSLISLSYLIWAGINLIVSRPLGNGFRIFSPDGLPWAYLASTYLHMGLFIAGLVTLAYTTLKVEKGNIYYLLLSLGLLVIASSYNKLITFRILSVFLLIFISYHYMTEWTQNKNKKTIMTMIAFILLLLSNTDFIFSEQFYISFIIGHLLELGAYAIILFGLVKTLKK